MKSKLNSRAVAMMRYAAGLVKCEKKKKNELRAIAIKTRKTMIMEIPQLDVDRLHILRNKGGPSPWTFPKNGKK